jgi:hypothetical protein
MGGEIEVWCRRTSIHRIMTRVYSFENKNSSPRFINLGNALTCAEFTSKFSSGQSRSFPLLNNCCENRYWAEFYLETPNLWRWHHACKISILNFTIIYERHHWFILCNVGKGTLIIISYYFKHKDVMKVICIHGTWMLNFALVTEEYRFHLCTRWRSYSSMISWVMSWWWYLFTNAVDCFAVHEIKILWIEK